MTESCPRCLNLMEEIEILKEEKTQLQHTFAGVHDFWPDLGLTSGTQVRFLQTLYKRKGGATKEMLFQVRNGHLRNDAGDLKTVDVQVCKLRDNLPKRDFIATVWGVGYKLTDEGRAWLEGELEKAGFVG